MAAEERALLANVEALAKAVLHKHGEDGCRWVGVRNLTTGEGEGHYECPFGDPADLARAALSAAPTDAERRERAATYPDGEREQRLVDDWATAFTFGVTITAPGSGTWQWGGVDPRRATAIHRYLRMAGYRVVTEGIGGGTQPRHGELGPS